MREWKARQTYIGKWYDLTNPHLIGCCDCGLVHKLSLRITDKGILQFKPSVQYDLTKSARSKKKYGFQKSKKIK
jgi:hypothetical protein